MPQIKAQDEIVLRTSIEEVWKILIDVPNYNKWWPKVVNLKVLKFDGELIGTEFKASPLGGKSFTCRVISINPNKEIKLNYFDGIYRGTGYWKIEGKDGILKVSYTVDLEIVDKSIAFLSRLISIPRFHSMIFKKILNNLESKITKE